jgi:hypothetical protein
MELIGIFYNKIMVRDLISNHNKLILNFNRINNLNIVYDDFIRFIIKNNILYIREHLNEKRINEFLKVISKQYNFKDIVFNTKNDLLINLYGGKW